ncbi:MAG: MFS transporter [Elusimicrobiales bacterium]|nr:MFS transporter [Elusimicrobiales bacterium]
MKKIIEFLSLKKNIAVLLTVVLFVELGERMGERFLPLYIIALGGGSIAIGLLNALDNFLSAVYSIPGGYLSDRFGYKKSLIFFNIMASIGYLIIIIFPYWQAAIVGAIFFISWSAISLPAIMSVISQSIPINKRTMGVTLHSITRRVPMALGPILGGACLSIWGDITGIRVAFSIAFILSVISIFIQSNLLETPKIPDKMKFRFSPLKMFKLINPTLKRLLISDILVRFCEQIPYAFVVIWCVKFIKIGTFQFGLLTAIEMITAILIYIPVAYMVENSGKKALESDNGSEAAQRKSKKIYIVISFIFFSAFPIFILMANSFSGLILAFIIRGLKEFGEPTRKALILDLSPKNSKAMAYGTYYFIRDIVVSVAALGGGFLWLISPEMTLITASGFGVLGTLYFIFYADLSEKMEDDETPPEETAEEESKTI